MKGSVRVREDTAVQKLEMRRHKLGTGKSVFKVF